MEKASENNINLLFTLIMRRGVIGNFKSPLSLAYITTTTVFFAPFILPCKCSFMKKDLYRRETDHIVCFPNKFNTLENIIFLFQYLFLDCY